MARYPVVLFDLDHTLFDFEASKRVAFAEVLSAEGIADGDGLIGEFTAVERPLWRQLEAGELTLRTLNDARFAALVEHAGLDADPARMARNYLFWLGCSGGLLPGARELLDALHGTCTLGLVSNGYSEVQRARLPHFDLDRYFDTVVVSSEIEVAKPDPRFFDHALDALGRPEARDVLVVGDSLTSDIRGAAAAGLPTCWYNPLGLAVPETPPIDHVVATLDDVAPIVLG